MDFNIFFFSWDLQGSSEMSSTLELILEFGLWHSHRAPQVGPSQCSWSIELRSGSAQPLINYVLTGS